MNRATMSADEFDRCVVYCDCPSEAEVCYFEEAQGWLYVDDDGSEHEYTATAPCPDCGKVWALPSTRKAERFIDEQEG